MVQIYLWAHKIAPIQNGKVGINQFRAMDICQNTAELLSRMYKGRKYCSSAEVVQYDNTVELNRLSKEDEEFITHTYPFASVRRPLFGDQLY